MNGHSSPSSPSPPVDRAQEIDELLTAVKSRIVSFIQAADSENAPSSSQQNGLKVNGEASLSKRANILVDQKSPKELAAILDLGGVQKDPAGKEGLLEMVDKVLQYSVNTWSQGFMDKLYASTNGVGLVSEMLLSALNTNAHVYQVSPVLTLIEKSVSTSLARLFYSDFDGTAFPYAGGISQPGGSASNSTSLTIARNTLFPETKAKGIASLGKRLILFTSEHGHYSLEKAAQIQGLGSDSVRSVPVDEQGRMLPAELERLIEESLATGEEAPFYVNATAGTTVLGSYDPFDAIGDICQKYGLWMHVDASWGGAVAFSEELRRERLRGVEKADTIAFNPHKMLATPLTCSFLVGKDLRQFWKAMTLPAGYLFHTESAGEPDPREMYDLADLTPQCGRRPDALKFYLSWQYHGTSGLRTLVEDAFQVAQYMADSLLQQSSFELVSPRKLPCTQVCFYYTSEKAVGNAERNSRTTEGIAKALIGREFMVDYAPGPRGKMLRVVVGIYTRRDTVDRLIQNIAQIGASLR